MRLEKAKIENYKSFGEPSTIYLGDENVISIIGKNESGKSNLLDALKMLSFSSMTNEHINFNKNNRSIGDGTAKIQILLKLSSDEMELLGISDNKTKIEFTCSDKSVSVKLVSGGIVEYFEKEQFSDLLSKIEVPVTSKQVAIGNERSNYNEKINVLKKANRIILRNYNNHLNWLKSNVANKITTEDREEYIKVLEDMRVYFENCYNLLPKFFKYNEISFKDSYVLNEAFFKNMDKENPEVMTFLKAIDMNVEDLKKASQGRQPGSSDMRDKIFYAVKEKIEKPFRKFYNTEPIVIKTDFYSNELSIQINSGSGNMNLSERSHGLKWYLSFFITLLANGLLDKNVVFLIDEPGIRLHVDAQKRLLELFKSKAIIGGNQIIYTTHSPFMIDKDNINSVRAIQKTNGQSQAIKAYSDEIDKASRLETLSPLLNAIGMKLSDNIGFDTTKINILTEGITDFIYLSAMKQRLSIDNCVIIPGNGADNLELMALILWGWGLDFIVILDNDKKGREIRNKLKVKFSEGLRELSPTKSNIISVKIEFSDSGSDTIESLISSKDHSVFGIDDSKINQLSNKEKIYYAHNFYNKIINEHVEISSETRQNFERIFNYVSNVD